MILLICGYVGMAQLKTAVQAADPITFRENGFDFGRIPQGKPAIRNFVITNTGTEPLVIENIQASCGCTTPEWKKEPVAPGKDTEIKVGYNAATAGNFEKTITVYYNGGKTKTLKIRGTVWTVAEQTAPRNNSVALLKNVN